MRGQRRRWYLVMASGLGVAACVMIAGCDTKEEIRTYRVAGPTTSETVPASQATTPPAERGEPTDRMLAAVISDGDRVWFLKAVGSTKLVETHEQASRELFASFDVGQEPPTWELPDDWSKEQGTGMRFATFRSPANQAGESLELSVIDLPRNGDWQTQLLGNLNRWRGQMGQTPITADQLSEATEPLDNDAQQSALIDIRGWFSGGMTPTAPPAQQPSVGAPPPRPQRELKYATPEGWVDQPGSAMRNASFKTAAGSEVTAFVFAAGGGMSDPVGNVNRWRGQVGLPPVTEEQLDASAKTIEISDGEATYVELLGEENATLAAMSERGPSIWFFKLTGSSDAVEADREAFVDWLSSLKF